MSIFKTIQSVDVNDFDALVAETYGRLYCFQQQDGCKGRGVENFSVPFDYDDDFENDAIPEKVNGDEKGVSFAAWLARDPKQPLASDESSLDLFWYRNFYPSFGMIVNDLHARGLIPAGKYQMVIDW